MIKNYFKIAFRNLRRNKAYTLINISGLALGMTCGLLIFILVKYHLGFDNFHANSNRIYRIVTEQHRDNISYTSGVPSPLGKVFRNDYTFGEKVARIATFGEQLITLKDGNELRRFKEKEGVAFTETEYFDIFNFPLIQGDPKTALNEPNTVILTERIARNYFGSESPINKNFQLDNRINLRVTGILKNLPENTDQKTEIFVSYPTLKAYNEWLASDDAWGGIQSSMKCFVLLRPQIPVTQVEKVLSAYVTRFRPESKNVHHYKLQPLAEMHFDGRYDGTMEKRNLLILSVIGLFLIATACVNFINLATAQAFKRSKEVGVRKVLGGLKGQLFWQFIAETAIVSVMAVTVALVISYIILPFANDFFKTKMTLNLFSDTQLFLFIVALTGIITFIAGSYPGIILSGFQPAVALKGKLSQQKMGGFSTRRSLIVAQFAISQILIIGMAVIINQIQYTNQADLGFDKEAIMMIPVGSDTTGIKMKTLKSQISEISGVEKISLCFTAPSSQESWNTSIRFDNQPEEVNFKTSIKAGDAAYISTFGLELVAGRNIFPTDSVREFLVNEVFIKNLNFKTPQEAIGKMVSTNGGTMVGPIVGIVKTSTTVLFMKISVPLRSQAISITIQISL